MNDDLPLPGAVVKLGEHYLLPRSEHEAAILKRYRKGGPLECGPQVAESIRVTPGIVMGIIFVAGNQLG